MISNAEEFVKIKLYVLGLHPGSSITNCFKVCNIHFQAQLNELCVKEMSPDEYYFQKPCLVTQDLDVCHMNPPAKWDVTEKKQYLWHSMNSSVHTQPFGVRLITEFRFMPVWRQSVTLTRLKSNHWWNSICSCINSTNKYSILFLFLHMTI
jgi:hypothetical protein